MRNYAHIAVLDGVAVLVIAASWLSACATVGSDTTPVAVSGCSQFLTRRG